jgi:hypothetical protein
MFISHLTEKSESCTMDPILQQLQHYYQQQYQRPAERQAVSNGAAEPVFNPQRVHGDEPVFNPWWLKLRRTLQHHAAASPQKVARHFIKAND